MEMAGKGGEMGAGTAKYLKYSKGLGTIGGVASTLYSGSLTYDQYQKGGIANVFQHRDVLDMGIGALGLGAGTLVGLSLISNPVGWTIGAGVLVYGGVTLIYDVYTEGK